MVFVLSISKNPLSWKPRVSEIKKDSEFFRIKMNLGVSQNASKYKFTTLQFPKHESKIHSILLCFCMFSLLIRLQPKLRVRYYGRIHCAKYEMRC